jgi:hypothetical protein
MKILRSEKMREVRSQIAGRELPLCGTCQYTDYGSTMINFEYRDAEDRPGRVQSGPMT